MSRRVFGLPRSHIKDVEKVTDRTALFLFNYTTKVRRPACASVTWQPPGRATTSMARPHRQATVARSTWAYS